MTRAKATSSLNMRLRGPGLALALVIFVLPTVASADEALARKYACATCHQATQTTIGPAWKDIRAKYSGKLSAKELAASVKRGSSGKWGVIPMPPQTLVPDSDLLELTTWILEGKP